MLSKDQFEEWVLHPGTIYMMGELRKRREQFFEDFESGCTMSSDAGTTAQQTALLIGQLGELQYVLNKEFYHNDV